MSMFIYGSEQLGLRYSLVVPNSTPFTVWFEREIVYFCHSLNEALGALEDIIDAQANSELEQLFGEGG